MEQAGGLVVRLAEPVLQTSFAERVAAVWETGKVGCMRQNLTEVGVE